MDLLVTVFLNKNTVVPVFKKRQKKLFKISKNTNPDTG